MDHLNKNNNKLKNTRNTILWKKWLQKVTCKFKNYKYTYEYSHSLSDYYFLPSVCKLAIGMHRRIYVLSVVLKQNFTYGSTLLNRQDVADCKPFKHLEPKYKLIGYSQKYLYQPINNLQWCDIYLFLSFFYWANEFFSHVIFDPFVTNS